MSSYHPIQHIPTPTTKRMVIVGGGFAGLTLALKMAKKRFQAVLIDRNNYHLFQPLLYQVAMSGLEPSAIAFPLRKVLQNSRIFFRLAELQEIQPQEKRIITDIGALQYDYLVLATGAKTNFFGNEAIARNAMQMKGAPDALFIRNRMLRNFEKSLNKERPEEISAYLNVAIIGGGPTGVELAGAVAEMRKYVLPKDYPELDMRRMKIMLFEASPRLLSGMSEEASATAGKYLHQLGVEVRTGTAVANYDERLLTLANGETIQVKNVIWAAGITSSKIAGLPDSSYGRGNRLLVNPFNEVEGSAGIFAIGDNCLLTEPAFPNGHPQVAQVALQQAALLAGNLIRLEKGLPRKPFRYKDKGSLATVGRHLAVADLPFGKFKGFFAWLLWSVVHLFSIVGVKNKLFVLLDWSWKYVTYDQALRLLIRHKGRV
ncbi:MAG: NAD(P)/FAD-dependent oxidoreductase [Marinilabiliales bacterium]|nr:NAD(P)/FAD-dependent oxidoreductase [Marinilabiliales bacterium]